MPPPSAAILLSKLTQLSPSVYLLDAPQSGVTSQSISDEAAASLAGAAKATSTRSLPPKLIILFTWMSAHLDHISKYVDGYRTHYPASRILIIRSSPLDFFYRPTHTQRARVAPAISALLSASCTTHSEPEVLLHVFSNGGSHQLRNFILAYSETVSRPFPHHITVLDSCPGRSTFKRTALALSSALPSFPPARYLLLLLIYLTVIIYWVLFIPFRIPDPIEHIRQDLNSRIVMQGETKRCYIYSDTDPMVRWDDVEAHAQDAAKRGFVVQCEKFEGTGHCAHARFGGGMRYWTIVNDMWQATRR